MNRLWDNLFSALIRVACVFGMAFLVLPLFVVVAVSFTETQYLRFPPQGISIRWYTEFVHDSAYVNSLIISCLLAFLSTVSAVILGISAAVGLSRFDFPGREVLKALVMSPLILPSIVIGAAMLQYASAFGFARTFAALVISHTVILIPYVVRTTLASLQRFDSTLEEAAFDLGASGFSAFWLITLPMIKPGVIAGALFAFIISWINVEVSMFQVTSTLMTIPVQMFNQVQYSVGPIVAAVSAGTIYLAVLLVIGLDICFGLDKITRSE